MTKYLWPLLLSIPLAVSAQTATAPATQNKVQWQLQITDPDFELKYQNLDDKKYKAFLPKTGWRCHTTETEVRGPIHLKKLHCDYSVEKTGTVTTIVSCSPDRPYSEAFLELYDERKEITFQIMLNCKSTP